MQGFHVIIHLDDIQYWLTQSMLARGHEPFFALFWFILDYTLIISKSGHCLTQHFLCLVLFWDTGNASVFAIWQTSSDTAACSFFFPDITSYCPSGNVLFGQDHHWCQLTCTPSVVVSEYLPYPSSFICSFHLSPPIHYQPQRLSHLQQSPIPMQSFLADVIIATCATPNHWSFSLQGSGLPSSCSRIWSVSIGKVHIALQRIEPIAPMLCKMAFLVTWWVVALHLDNITAEAYLHNHSGTSSHFSF